MPLLHWPLYFRWVGLKRNHLEEGIPLYNTRSQECWEKPSCRGFSLRTDLLVTSTVSYFKEGFSELFVYDFN